MNGPSKKDKSAKEKAARYCSLQERSQHQVREKLADYGVYGEEAEEIITELIMLDFINEERFARAYVRGKFRIKKWGPNKIRQGLYQHRISEYCTRKAFEEIEDIKYHLTLRELLEKYTRTLKSSSAWENKNRSSRYLIGKGYEPADVYEIVNEYYK